MAQAYTGTRFLQGALSGGGYLQGISISNDGLTRLISYDSSNAWIWNDTTSQWDNAFNQFKVPAYNQPWGILTANHQSHGTNDIVVAPSDYRRVYAIVVWAGGGDLYEANIWRSDDRCENWVDTGYNIGAGTTILRGMGPRLVVDPNNPNIVYVGDNAGVVHRSFDAGGTWEKPTSLSSLMLTEITNGTTAGSSKVLNFAATPADVITRNGYTVYASNVTRQQSIVYALYVSSTTATTATLNNVIGGSSGVSSGDTIAFGQGVCIAFDPSSGTTNGRTNRIYIGWGYGSSGMYVSEDAGQTWTLTTGGPAQFRWLHCSNDGVVYACDFSSPYNPQSNTQNAWRYQSGTWTNFSITGASGNVFNCIVSDPLNVGHVVAIQNAGNIRMSTDYGTNWVGLGNTNLRSATDAPWLANTLENWQTQGRIAFDPVVNNRLWIVEGIGVWYCTPPYANSTITINSQNKNQQGLIVNRIIKPPGQHLLVGTQDRSTIQLPSLTSEPAYESGIGAAIGAAIIHTWDVDYAKSDPTFVVCLVSQNCYVSSQSGAYNTWTRRENTVPGANLGGCLAVQTPNNIVYFPANNGTPGYSTDSGMTWSSCLFNGVTKSTGWSNSLYANRRMVVCDPVDANTYYAFSYSNDATGGLWRSTDGGANWTNMSGGLSPFSFTISSNFQMCAIPGKQGHVMVGYGANYNNGIKLYRTVDAGVTWAAVTNTGVAWQVAAGKEKPGASYPAIYMTGTLNGDSDPGIFRADDFTDDTSVIPTWTRLCRAPAGNIDTPKSLWADLETYGKVYVGFGSTGYAWGELVSIYGKF